MRHPAAKCMTPSARQPMPTTSAEKYYASIPKRMAAIPFHQEISLPKEKREHALKYTRWAAGILTAFRWTRRLLYYTGAKCASMPGMTAPKGQGCLLYTSDAADD